MITTHSRQTDGRIDGWMSERTDGWGHDFSTFGSILFLDADWFCVSIGRWEPTTTLVTWLPELRDILLPEYLAQTKWLIRHCDGMLGNSVVNLLAIKILFDLSALFSVDLYEDLYRLDAYFLASEFLRKCWKVRHLIQHKGFCFPIVCNFSINNICILILIKFKFW